MYTIIAWGNSTKTIMRNLQVKQKNLIVKIIYNKFGRKTRLLPVYKSLNVLKIESIYKLELAKFIFRVHAKSLPNLFCKYFDKVIDVHLYSTRSVQSNKYYLTKCLHAKSSQSLKIAEIKVWNDLSNLIRDKLVHIHGTKSANIRLKIIAYSRILNCNDSAKLS